MLFRSIPSLASVYNEFALKKHMDTSVLLQNFFLYFYGGCMGVGGWGGGPAGGGWERVGWGGDCWQMGVGGGSQRGGPNSAGERGGLQEWGDPGGSGSGTCRAAAACSVPPSWQGKRQRLACRPAWTPGSTLPPPDSCLPLPLPTP